MHQDDVDPKLRTVMGQVFKLAPEDIPSQASRDELPQWDSLKHLTLMLALEDAFGVEFSDHEIAGIRSFTDLAVALRSRVT